MSDVDGGRELAIGDRHEPAIPGERQRERHESDQPGGEDPPAIRHGGAAGPRAGAGVGGDARRGGHGPDELRLDAAASRPPMSSQATTTATRPAMTVITMPSDAAERDVLRGGASDVGDPTGSGSATIGARTSRPPRTRNAASASEPGRPAVASDPGATPVSVAPELMARGWRWPAPERSPGRARRALERGLDLVDLLAIAGEVAVTQGRLGELEVVVGVLDQRQARRPEARPAGPGAGAATRRRGVGSGVGLGDGPGSATASRRPPPRREEQAQRLAQRPRPDDLARRGDDDPLELRERRPVDWR